MTLTKEMIAAVNRALQVEEKDDELSKNSKSVENADVNVNARNLNYNVVGLRKKSLSQALKESHKLRQIQE